MSPVIAVIIPFLGALAIAVAAGQPRLRDTLSFLLPIPLFLTVVSVAIIRLGLGDPMIQPLIELVPGLEITLAVQPLGLTFALLAATLYLAATPYAIGYMRAGGYDHLGRFMACYAIALGATMGIAFAENLLTLYVFYEILSISTYPLVAHTGTDKARAGARTYIALLLVTSVGLMLPAMIWIWQAAGTLSFTSGGILAGQVGPGAGAALLVILLYGIGKAALMPFHRWLPAAMVAPTPVSALLHAVAVVKAGVFSVLTVVLYIFGLDYVVTLVTQPVMLYLAVFTMIAASLVALHQDNLKSRLAYSTVSQLAYIVTGALLATELSALGGGLHMLMHGFGKITLFFCAGAIYVASGINTVSGMNGLARRMPLTMLAFFIGALCVIGLPPTGGFWSKWYLVNGAWLAEHYVIVAAFVLSTLLNIAYLLPPVMRAFLKPLPEGDSAAPVRIQEAPALCLIPLLVTAAGTLVLFVLADPALQMLKMGISS
ncbi:MAG: monovalent cation/H+ antiporter subunit D family protein [Spiribacter salinus]|jgi:multicomponent Na+:H+ antiporter subunit D|uniref:Monovalent cation/H+ antiporter subunit D family protein n=1 Tax=Spiribacter salinus TaxID=1335746 RepID=A0A540VVL1_9GAMM|nr:proton-conducting transporter membrane subunit [Spiribacter sp.]MDR9454738.1 proton-conducting transporter membrane subunit [Spiribacter sp.]TQF00778.1 MAG: monovalent cation/H+ antiporter subunit D family protein [Spiribacter salinus]